jgi:hypothetical protein
MTPASHPRLRLFLRFVALGLAAVNVAAAIQAESMGEDGINYLDQGDAWWRGDWPMAVNGTWSPLYPVLLGLVMRVVRPSMEWEFPLVHLLNFALFVFALGCFEFFWRQAAARYYAAVPGETAEPDRLPSWAFMLIGYCLFIWAAVCLIRLFAVTPDMLVAAFTFLAGGLLLRLPAADDRWTIPALGAALGAGYLAKAVLFPLGIVVMLVAGIILVRSGRSATRLVPGLAAFLVVASPLLVPLSVRNGGFTFSEVGRTSYLRHVLDTPYPHYVPGSPNVQGEPVHPFDRSSTSPVVFRYAGAIGSTFPPAYDQGHWYEGVEARFRPMLQLRAIVLNLQRYFELFLRMQGIMVGVGLVLLVLVMRHGQNVASTGGWSLALVSLVALSLYVLVYVEGRYVAPFIVLLWAGLLLSVRLRPAAGNGAWLTAAATGVAAALAINVGAFHLDGFNALTRIAPVVRAGPVSRTVRPSARPSAVAAELQRLGLERGDSIGVIGEAIAATWARLGRLRIVADVEPAQVEAFWAGTADQQQTVLNAFLEAGVHAVVAEPPSDGSVPGDWTRVGTTGFVVRLISNAGDSRGVPAPTR